MILTLIIASSSLSGFAEKQAAEDIALSVVLDMNDACNARDVQRCLTFYSRDTDFENSYGWTVKGREALRNFMANYLFVHYPKSDAIQEDESIVELLAPDVAYVDLARRITPMDGNTKSAVYRFAYVLKADKGKWLIWKTRIWKPGSAEAPHEFVEANRFPTIQNLN